MRSVGIYMIIFFGLFHFSEGKPCPDKTRPHKTRCDAYYKCQDIPPKAHVWIPSVCEQGLIYEHNLKLCVLPEDDWECVLEDSETSSKSPKEVVTLHMAVTEEITPDFRTNKDSDVDIVGSEQVYNINDSIIDESVQLVADNSMSSEEENDGNDYEASGNGETLMDLNDVLQAETREADDKIIATDNFEHKESDSSMHTSSKIDPKLTTHLQRLSQLIDGLKQTYQNQDNKQTELRPDQLNAFLAHFNIKNQFNELNPISENDLQHSVVSVTKSPLNISSRLTKFQGAFSNKTDLQDHLGNKMKPETKLLLSSAMSKRYGNPGGFSSSQIVVNHPEGSVMFSLPSYGNDQNYVQSSHIYESHNSPKISEDTLKTVLELSKQMIATQNVPKVIQNPAYYPQPIIQPVYLSTASFPGTHGSPFSSYFNSNNKDNNNNGDYDDDNHYSYSTNSHHHKPHGHKHGYNKHGQNSNNGFSKPSTTVIHNNIIPLHVTSTNSGEKEVVDSYGQSLGHYPPLNMGDNANNGYNQHHNHFSDHYEGNHFLTSFTTKRPSAITTPKNHYSGQYPSPYPTEISMTTVPSLVSEYYTPSEHLNENNVHHFYQSSERHPQAQYGTMPRPMDSNQVERPNQQQQPFYGQNQQNSLLSSQISSNVKVRPSAQQVESMEMNASVEDDSNDEQYAANQQAFSYSNNNNGLSNQYGSMISPGNNNNYHNNNHNHNHHYMSRPHSGSVSSTYSSSFSMGSNNKPKFPSYGLSTSHSVDGMQLVNVGGNFIRYDVFQNTILPMLGHSQNDELNNVEVITCATGIRQPNTTDCTRYYVCSKKDGKVLSYSCPPYTAFNAQTRICDAHTYSLCTPTAIANSYTVTENKRIQMEAFQALQEAKRRREQAIKAQSISNLLQYDAELNPSPSSESGNSQEKDMLNAYVQQAAIMANMATSTARPPKKRKYYCKEGDKIPDQTSIYSYFVCFKNAQGMMKGHKMTCSKGLLFCPKTTMCTLSIKCS